jgi:hypothetical protein
MQRRLQRYLRWLGGKLRWDRVVRTWSNMVRLRRRRHATTHRPRSWGWRADRSRGTWAVGGRTRRLAVHSRRRLPRAHRALRCVLRWWANPLALLIRVELLGRQSWVAYLGQRTIPYRATERRRSWALWRLLRLRRAPLRSSGSMYRCWLIGLRMNVLRSRGIARIGCTRRVLSVLEELQACLDMYVGRIQVSCPLVCVKSVGGLVVARLVLWHGQHDKEEWAASSTYQSSQVIPNLGDVGIQPNSTGVCVERIAVLIDLVV